MLSWLRRYRVTKIDNAIFKLVDKAKAKHKIAYLLLRIAKIKTVKFLKAKPTRFTLRNLKISLHLLRHSHHTHPASLPLQSCGKTSQIQSPDKMNAPIRMNLLSITPVNL